MDMMLICCCHHENIIEFGNDACFSLQLVKIGNMKTKALIGEGIHFNRKKGPVHTRDWDEVLSQ